MKNDTLMVWCAGAAFSLGCWGLMALAIWLIAR